MGSIEEEFAKAAKYVQELPKEGPYKLAEEVKYKFYGLYKQATEGTCHRPKPMFLLFTARKKWTSWVALGQMSKLEAMTIYVEEYQRLRSKFEAASAALES